MNNKLIYFLVFISIILIGGYYYFKKNQREASDMPEISYVNEGLVINSAYAYATTPTAKTGAAFFTIQNLSGENDRLIDVSSNLSEFTELHQNYIDPQDNVMMMRKIKDLEIPNEQTVEFTPSGYHIMFINLKEPFVLDQSYQLVLSFEKSEEKIVIFKVVTPGMDMHSMHK